MPSLSLDVYASTSHDSSSQVTVNRATGGLLAGGAPPGSTMLHINALVATSVVPVRAA